MEKLRVLFVCIHNSARSQMAEAFLKQLGGDRFEVESAGFEPGTLNPIVVDAMKEISIDLSNNQTNDLFDYYKQGRMYSYVIAVCDAANAERCPIFPGLAHRLNWSFEDPSSFLGSYEEKLAKTRAVRDNIKAKIEDFINQTPINQ